MIVTKSRYTGYLPPPLLNIQRVESLNILGVSVASNLAMTEHINTISSKCSQLFYGLKILKNHGLSNFDLDVTFRSLVISRITYASPAWRGFANAADLNKLNSLLRRGYKWGLTTSLLDLECLLNKADSVLFNSLLSNSHHVLYPLLPQQRQLPYSLRPRAHNFVLPRKNNYSSFNFLTRMLYSNIST